MDNLSTKSVFIPGKNFFSTFRFSVTETQTIVSLTTFPGLYPGRLHQTLLGIHPRKKSSVSVIQCLVPWHPGTEGPLMTPFWQDGFILKIGSEIITETLWLHTEKRQLTLSFISLTSYILSDTNKVFDFQRLEISLTEILNYSFLLEIRFLPYTKGI